VNVTYDFGGRVALVTGGGSGIGRASAEAFGRAGATVAVADISLPSAEATVGAIRAAGGAAHAYRADVSAPEAVRGLITDIVADLGGLDFAHNNAGIEGEHVPTADIAIDDWRRVVDIDLNAVFYCMKAEIEVMALRGHGVIVNTSSASGLIGGYNLGAYTAAKHGVIGLTKAAAADHARSGVRINAVCPGAIDTPFIAELPPAALQRLMLGTPMDRAGQPDEIAQGVLWLCSDGASYVTGTALSIDGGVLIGGTGTRFDDIEF
tara:strand:+ start:17107 stop:17898 length:792 start_codon:yes stop_codon:yes gene_type:complete